MILFLISGLAIIFLLLKIWQFSPKNPSRAWPQIRNEPSVVKFEGLKIVKYISLLWWAQPGAFVQILSVKSITRTLPQPFLNISQNEFLSLKQFLWSIGSVLLIISLWVTDLSLKNSLIWISLLLVIVLLPDIFLLQKSRLFQRQYEKQVPYFLDLLTLTLQGGSNLEQALISTTRNYDSQLSRTISHKLNELNWGRSLEMLFKDLSLEIKDEDFQHFLHSVIRAKKLGVSLCQTLIIQSEILRTRRRQKAEELSRTASVKISIPLVLFIFPALLIIYIGPGILQLLERT
ncbi:type II secretion system F family protein [bacterium]|nr:type II secretion system F family protein [bacterium]NCQ54942.1 type II secretion system F family protein [Candidatus Parcubacteria bacterium]NCS66986.1 type II secretion system F family protein [Candidatus Peregrinibacteria bacterium]NCS95932.1 type II secretion system F family protein [bacterium]